MTKMDYKHHIELKYMVIMKNGDAFDGQMGIGQDEPWTQKDLTLWWNKYGDDFIPDVVIDIYENQETNWDPDDLSVAFVTLIPETTEYNHIMQICSNPEDWAQQAKWAYEHLQELTPDQLEPLPELVHRYKVETGSHLTLVDDTDDEWI